MTEPILSVRDLSVRYRTKDATVHAVDSVSLDLHRGEVLAVVGESGSGKTTAAMSLLRLLPQQAEITGGQVIFEGQDLLSIPDRDLRKLRARRIAMIFQDPVAGLNPVIAIGDQVAETLTSHLEMSRKEAKARAVEVLREVGLADPERVAKAYPFQLSGGMCQRVMVGIATVLNPDILIADEPTSALDVTIQAQILHQLNELRRTRGTSILLITHDFGVVAQMADQVAVMYGGRVVESADVASVLKSPLHPYSHGLLATLPRLDRPIRPDLPSIPGAPPELKEPAEHCPFIPRCPKVLLACRGGGPPPLEPFGESARKVACYNPIWQG
ncbi:MAG: ABC transporter ATP-binding protein [Chloroflexi bacterium]|nr:ABC transporter ATP-binding protein [Chloroflexota bacterium]